MISVRLSWPEANFWFNSDSVRLSWREDDFGLKYDMVSVCPDVNPTAD